MIKIKLSQPVKEYFILEREFIRKRINSCLSESEHDKLETIWRQLGDEDLAEARRIVASRAGWKASIEWYDAYELD